jgi:hypothetical protein
MMMMNWWLWKVASFSFYFTNLMLFHSICKIGYMKSFLHCCRKLSYLILVLLEEPNLEFNFCSGSSKTSNQAAPTTNPGKWGERVNKISLSFENLCGCWCVLRPFLLVSPFHSYFPIYAIHLHLKKLWHFWQSHVHVLWVIRLKRGRGKSFYQLWKLIFN